MKVVNLIIIMTIGWINVALAGVGFIAGVQGESRVIRASESLPATLGMAVELGDRLVTGKKARIKVLFSDDSLVTVGGKTELTITTHLFDAKAKQRKTVIELIKGKMRALVQKEVAGTSGAFEVHTKNAVAGVRGTEFVISSINDKLRLWTISGNMELVDNDGAKKLVAAGEGCEVKNGVVTASHALAQAEISKVRSRTDLEQLPTALALNQNIVSPAHIKVTDRIGAPDRIGTPDRIVQSPAGPRITSNESWSNEPTLIPKVDNTQGTNPTITVYGSEYSLGNSFHVSSRDWKNESFSQTSLAGFSRIVITIKGLK
jgi:hypothetical protein